MAITFPRAFPFDGAFTGDCAFDLVRNQTRNLTGSASPDVADVAPPYWAGSWSTRVLTRADLAEWEAWLSSLRGGLRMFKGRPNRARWPISYPRGFAGLVYDSNPFTGLGNLDAIGEGRDTIIIDALPNGFKLVPGDWLSIPVGSRQHLHRVTEGGVASGNEVTVSVEPTINPAAVDDVAVRLDTPYCEMVLTAQPDVGRAPVKGGSVSFSGQQILI